jgi:hypothetical protein
MEETKFLYIKEGLDSGTLLAQDGGVIIIWHNDEHYIAQCYKERLERKYLDVSYNHAFEKMNDSSSNSSLIDFEDGQKRISLEMLEEISEFLVCPSQGGFIENLIYINIDDVTEEELDNKVKEFLKDVTE